MIDDDGYDDQQHRIILNTINIMIILEYKTYHKYPIHRILFIDDIYKQYLVDKHL